MLGEAIRISHSGNKAGAVTQVLACLLGKPQVGTTYTRHVATCL